MADLMDNLVCGCDGGPGGCEDGKCGCAAAGEEGLSGPEMLLLVYKELVRTAERIGQNLPDAEPIINVERTRGAKTVTLAVTVG